MTEFKSELTAISTKHSKSAEMILNTVTKGQSVLDYGCGTGRNLVFINEGIKDINLVGCDIAEQLERCQKKHDNIRDMGIKIIETNNIDKKFDLILCSHVLNVIEDDGIKTHILKDIKEHLKSNGKAILEVRTASDINRAKSKEKFGNGYKIKKEKNFTYQEAISKEKMESMINNVGLHIKEHTFNSSKHIVIVEN